MSLDDLMEVTIDAASKFEQKLSEAPASITVITAEDIRVYGYRNLADILASVSGVFTRYDRNYHHLGVRGFSRPGDFNTRFLLLVDGHRMNDNIFEQAALGNDFILNVDLIERVEVIRGASSSLYGTNGFLWIINVKTKSGAVLDGPEISAEAGRFGTGKGRLTYGKQFKSGIDLLLSASRYKSDGNSTLYYKEFDAPSTNHGVAKNVDGEALGNVFARLAVNDFTLAAGYNSRRKEVPTGAFETVFNDGDNETTDARGFAGLKYDRRLDRGSFKARLYYDYFRQRGFYVSDYAEVGDPQFLVNNVDAFNSGSAGGEWQLTRNLFGSHVFVLGGEYRNTFRQNLENSDIDVYLREHTRSHDWAVFLQDEFEIFENLKLNAGVRYDRSQHLGFKQWGGVRVYSQWIDDLITQQTDPADGLLVYRNTNGAEQRGVEFEWEGRWESGFRSRMSYALQQTKDLETRRTMVNSPTHLIKWNAAAPIYREKLFLGLEHQWTGRRRTLAGAYTRHYFISNATVFSDKLIGGLELSASVYNLFNRQYSDPAGPEHVQDTIRQDGRSFRFKLTYRF